MKKTLVLSLALALAQFLSAQEISKRLDSLIVSYANSFQFNGSVLVAMRGKILLEKGYGAKNVADRTANDAATIFQLGSITKQFTSTIILKLVESKKMSLTDKLSKYYPDYPHGDAITIENLLTHTSGIYNYTNDADFMRMKAYVPASEQSILALFKDKPLDFPPGTGWNYSNSGYELLGYIIQKVTKMPYEQVVRRYIFEPLHMNSSGFDFADLKSKDRATGYSSMLAGSGSASMIVDSTVAFAAGAMYSTVGDLYKWHEGLESYKIVSRALMERAYTPFKNKYGYGWGIDTVNKKRVLSHGGGIPGFNTHIARVTEDDVCIVLLSNVNNGKLGEIAGRIFRVLYE
jgi:CubicO group peptidase (beta-lactamase class C family)